MVHIQNTIEKERAKTAKNKGMKTEKGVAIQEKEEEVGKEKEKGGRKRSFITGHGRTGFKNTFSFKYIQLLHSVL